MKLKIVKGRGNGRLTIYEMTDRDFAKNAWSQAKIGEMSKPIDKNNVYESQIETVIRLCLEAGHEFMV